MFYFGRLPAHPEDTHPRLKLSPFLRAAAPPPSVDWYTRVTDWPMYGNDQIGDCTEAMVGHIIENASSYGEGQTVVIEEEDVLAAYERVSGYNPDDPSTDQGAVLQDVYGDWRKTGVGGHKALCFAQVNRRNLDEVELAVDQFGAVGLGITVTQAMMDDFQAGKPWRNGTGEDLGGHAVPIVGYDKDYLYVVTWGRVQPMSRGLFMAVADEAWVAVLPEWFKDGKDPEGLDLVGLGQAFSALTGEPSPFPAPSPVPPGPVPESADEVLAAAVGPWLKHDHPGSHRIANALRTWMKAKGL